ncbi:17-beta-hydroxysteroid dehydrogenase 14-like [Mercenaria mercenaria]|uniref:17-beta-hydroxysteroid dehydrogenase 14-like n=1 Tax=Mercenaria mercenaria TaxID=6596 RepID=UPI00234E55EF|nr:17-beta-hydroxysteroid dehydrogenase 14-like [Mercenaria mercenaria]
MFLQKAIDLSVQHFGKLDCLGGVKALTKALAIDEAKHGVRVNSLAPGAVDTVSLREKVPAEQREYLEKCHTLGRLAQPREIGKACLFLAVDATFTTGEELMCTGGAEIGYGVKDPNSLY